MYTYMKNNSKTFESALKKQRFLCFTQLREITHAEFNTLCSNLHSSCQWLESSNI